MIADFIHYGIHFGGPFFIALFFYRKNFWWAVALLNLNMLIDLDHLWSTPIFKADRCSIDYHFMHSVYAIIFYILLSLIPHRTLRLVGMGLIIHIIADFTNCFLIYNNCSQCVISKSIRLLFDAFI
jgi:hypothetical protein